MKKLIITVVGVVLAGCLGLPLMLAGPGGATGTCSSATSPGLSGFDDQQVAMARIIVDVGVEQDVPQWGWVVAVATALQESGLRNLPHLGDANDHDSIGVFQQRPSQGWGTPRQLADPAYQARAFYARLLRLPGWQQMPLAAAAQAVQRSAHPDAYGRWTHKALELVTSLTGTAASCDPTASAQLPADFTLPPTTPAPVVVAITWALEQLGTPYAFGGSCTDPHGSDPRRQCDCSSLVQQAYRAASVTLPRVTTDQVRAGVAVESPSLLQPGDLIFVAGSLGSRTRPRHVGMYLSGSLVIQAPASGDVVKVSSLRGWSADIVAIRRVVS